MIKVLVNKHGSKLLHAAVYDQTTQNAKVLCSEANYLGIINDYTLPTVNNVTCKKCIKLMNT
ncbi:hypothetical protein P4V41_07340 [Fictibacillus nanhaiensis]|uniref:hypothetical protein n=1 Tax=Fictibacillus nanhaiensis TaxID=742169 RepID=UPI002E1D7B5D|nr:hypothetical protein [Fictibacillus nanhaiensis]